MQYLVDVYRDKIPEGTGRANSKAKSAALAFYGQRTWEYFQQKDAIPSMSPDKVAVGLQRVQQVLPQLLQKAVAAKDGTRAAYYQRKIKKLENALQTGNVRLGKEVMLDFINVENEELWRREIGDPKAQIFVPTEESRGILEGTGAFTRKDK